MGSQVGAIKAAACRIGISPEAYQQHLNAGEKWCFRCDTWHPRAQFALDASRSDGLKAACRQSDQPRQAPGPAKPERQAMREQGLYWCRYCKVWLSDVRAGLCRSCRNTQERRRYADDPHYQARRQDKTAKRKRGVAGVPADAIDALMEEFDGQCAYCCGPATTWDHIIPVALGGKTTPTNIVPACVSCNSSKKNRDLMEWLMERRGMLHERVFDRMDMAHLF